MALSYIALGSNLGGRFADPAAAVAAALVILNVGNLRVIARSRPYRSTAWPDPTDPEFINAVAAVETELSPVSLLGRLHQIEAEFGRVRRRANAPRPLDLDIVDYAGMISIPGENPVLPHPRMVDRAFVLMPLAEIAPDWRHPVTGTAIANLVRALPGTAQAAPL